LSQKLERLRERRRSEAHGQVGFRQVWIELDRTLRRGLQLTLRLNRIRREMECVREAGVRFGETAIRGNRTLIEIDRGGRSAFGDRLASLQVQLVRAAIDESRCRARAGCRRL